QGIVRGANGNAKTEWRSNRQDVLQSLARANSGFDIRIHASCRNCDLNAAWPLMRDSLIVNRRVLRRHVLNHPGQMRHVVHVDDRVDEIACETIVATATGCRTNEIGSASC